MLRGEVAGELGDVVTQAESGRRLFPNVGRLFAPTTLAVIAIERVVTDWDLTDNDGKPLPINRETLDPLPVYVIRRIGDAIDDYFESRLG